MEASKSSLREYEGRCSVKGTENEQEGWVTILDGVQHERCVDGTCRGLSVRE